MKEKHSLISASEVGDYLFCALAWRLRAEGHTAASLQAARDAGTAWHQEHGRSVAHARRLRAAAMVLLLAALFFALLLLLYVVLR